MYIRIFKLWAAIITQTKNQHFSILRAVQQLVIFEEAIFSRLFFSCIAITTVFPKSYTPARAHMKARMHARTLVGDKYEKCGT